MKTKELEIALTTYRVAYKKGYTQSQEDMADNSKVTRFEVIDDNGRVYTTKDCKVELSYQDDGRTLKVFINSLKKQDNEQLCECSSKILPNGKIQLHLCKKCNEELFKEP